MPRRNLHLILLVAVVSLLCYRKADSEYRSRYGRMFDTFTEVLRKIDQHYVEPVDERNLFEGAMEGLVGRLDRYSSFIGPDGTIELRESLENKFGGIGIEVSWDRETKELTVMSPLVGTPAYEHGILPGDKIIGINGESTERFTLDDAVHRMRGEPGTEVRLSIRREGRSEPLEMVIRRAVIQVDTVLGISRRPDGSWNYLLETDPPIAYLRITSFGEHTVPDLKAVLKRLDQKGIQGLVLDLRENSGGLFKAGNQTCDLFLKQGLIVTTRGRDGRELDRVEANGRAPYANLPLVVLVNQFSASASEIVAACLQDHQRAVVVGQRTFGKGTVQNLIWLEDGRSTLKLTVANYWRPSGRNIHRFEGAQESDDWGVRPSDGFEVLLTDEQLAEVIRARRRREQSKRPPAVEPAGETPGDSNATEAADTDTDPYHDPQLARALSHLRTVLAGRDEPVAARD